LYLYRVNIQLTFDYELFFGKRAGSVEKCLIEPTNALLTIFKCYGIQATFFVDAGYLLKLKELAPQFQSLQNDLDAVVKQLKAIQEQGSSIQLHIHPHWEKAAYLNNEWVFDMNNCYKLADFEQGEMEEIVRKYKACLDFYSTVPTTVFRAGGWCIQPFQRLKAVFKELNIQVDSSVIPNVQFASEQYDFDFTTAPQKAHYTFDNDVCVEDENGFFTEIPITSFRYSPFFYWRLYGLGRLFPSQHKMMGDGLFLTQPKRKNTQLSQTTWNHVSCDGFYAIKMKAALKSALRNEQQGIVIIGHPKGMTQFSLKKLAAFCKQYHNIHAFKALSVNT
jgi:hypothetical protein